MVEEPEDHPTVVDQGDDADEEATTVNSSEIGPGSDVGGYIIEGELGRGGMGVVYAATHPVIGKRAAIKVLKTEVGKSVTTVERFIQEARAVNQIGHPNIIDIFAFGKTHDGRAYHIMDLLVGEPLRARLKRGALHPSEAASVIEEIASALTAAHDKGFVHRDLKPDNVYLVTHDGRWPEVKLLDFGLCKLMPEAGMQAPFRTKTGLMLGTPEYMSPEQARGQAVDYRTDIYALGILTFEILTGRRPFPTRRNPFETLQAHATDPPPSLKLLLPNLPDDLIQLVEAMLAKDRDERPTLAAVRTVIKRLRSTQLPSRTIAGLEMQGLHPGSNPQIQLPPQVAPIPSVVPTLANIGPSALGASPMVPQQQQPRDRPSQPPVNQPMAPPQRPSTNPPMRPSNPSNPPYVPVPSTRPSQPPPMGVPASGPPSQAPYSNYAVNTMTPSQYNSSPDPTQLQSRYGSINPVTDPGVHPPSHRGSAPSLPSLGPIAPPPAPSSAALRAANAPIPQTTLGIGPQKPPTSSMGVQVPAGTGDKINPLFIVIGALVAIGLGVGLALALVH